jgi:hypothetical protein
MSYISRRAWSFDRRNQINFRTPIIPIPIQIKNTNIKGNLIVSDNIVCKGTEKINTGTEITTTSITIPTPDYLNGYPNYDPFTFVVTSADYIPDPNLSIYALDSSINVTTAQNLAIGKNSLKNNKTGIANYAIGPDTLYTNTSGSSNTALGFKTLYNNTSGNSNTAIGSYALYANNGEWVDLYGDQFGSFNVAVGSNALMSNTKGYANTALGVNTLFLNTEGTFNVAIGTLAMSSNLTGSDNAVVGGSALTNNTTGNQNTAVGISCLRSNKTGSYNTSVGRSGLFSLEIGDQNTALGRRAGLNMVNGENNTFLGALTNVDISGNTYSNSTAIGCGAIISASNQIVLGTSSETINFPGKIQIPTTTTNPIAGKVTLVSGTAIINTTSVSANSLVFLTASTSNANSGFLSYTKIDGTSFTINSSNILDDNTINWLIIN